MSAVFILPFGWSWEEPPGGGWRAVGPQGETWEGQDRAKLWNAVWDGQVSRATHKRSAKKRYSVA